MSQYPNNPFDAESFPPLDSRDVAPSRPDNWVDRDPEHAEMFSGGGNDEVTKLLQEILDQLREQKEKQDDADEAITETQKQTVLLVQMLGELKLNTKAVRESGGSSYG